jgi:hypothetical protein
MLTLTGTINVSSKLGSGEDPIILSDSESDSESIAGNDVDVLDHYHDDESLDEDKPEPYEMQAFRRQLARPLRQGRTQRLLLSHLLPLSSHVVKAHRLTWPFCVLKSFMVSDSVKFRYLLYFLLTQCSSWGPDRA